MRDDDFAIHCLRETLKLLALSVEEQFAVLPSYVVAPDELALSFDDAYQPVPLLHERGHMTTEARNALATIDELLSDMTDDGDALGMRGPAHDPRWDEIRHLAVAALRHQRWPRGWPVLDWLSYIPGEGPD